MGEALEQAKTKLGLGNNKRGGENTRRDISSLEEVLSKIDDLDARDALRARVREITANANLRATEAEEQLKRLGGANMEDPEKRKEAETKLRDQITTTAITLLERDVDPKIVGQYILGSTPVTPITVSGGVVPPQGFTIDDVQKIMNMATAGKGESELKTTLENLTAQIKELGERNNRPVDPIAFATQQAVQIKATYEALKTMGIIKEPEVSTEGKPLIVVQEEHRHDERMEEIQVDREYKRELTKVISDIPERVGRGIAGQFGTEGESGNGGGLEYITCPVEGCGKRIYITPETGDTLTCVCGAIYSRKETVGPKKE